jgi:thymidylate synthase (FAD)
MKIIPASFEILQDGTDLAKQIEARGRICYKSESKITNTSAEKFCETYRNHGTVFEMAIVHIQMENLTMGETDALVSSKYLIHDQNMENSYATGSVRAWREWLMSTTCKFATGLANNVHNLLMLVHPALFADIKVCPLTWNTGSKLYLIEPRYIPAEFRNRHIHQAVRIITNRAVTHEIVRHRPCSFLQESQRYCRYDKEQFGNEVTFIDPSIAFECFGPGQLMMAAWKQACERAEGTYLAMLGQGVSPQAARTVLPNSCKTEIIVYTSLTEWSHIFAQRTSPAAEPSMREIMIPLHEEFKKLYPGVFDELSPSVAGR